MSMFKQNMAIDLGSANIRICTDVKDVALTQPSSISVRKETGEIVAIGGKSKKIDGKTEEGIETIKPIKNGESSEYTITVSITGTLMDEAVKNPLRRLLRPDVMTAYHCNTTSVGKRATERALKEAGAGRIFFVETPIASAVGANLDISSEKGKMIVNIGAEITDIAVISFNGIVTSESVPVGGTTFDNAVKNYFKKEHKMILSDNMAENIKINYLCVSRDERVDPFEVSAIELQSRLPIEKTVKPDELVKPLNEAITPILDSIRNVLERTPPELVTDIFERGITLTGGGSKLAGLDSLISITTGIDTTVINNPEKCVVLGCMKLLNEMSNDRKNELMNT